MLEPLDDKRGWLHLTHDRHEYRARAAALTVPYPSGLKRLLAAEPQVEAVLLEAASRGFDRAAAEEGVGYLDLRGRGRLLGPGFVYVAPPLTSGESDVEERAEAPGDDPWEAAPRARPSRVRVSPFAPKASRVVRALLADHARRWRLSELAERCRMNPGNVHRVLGALIDQGFLARAGDLYVVEDPGSLLEAWAEHGRRSLARDRLSVPVADELDAWVRRLVDALDGGAAVSGELAAELYAPHLAASRAVIHCIDEDAWNRGRLMADAERRPLRPQGHIVLDLVDDGVADFGEVRNDLPLVSPAQLYFDLARERTRAREAAEHVRRAVLRY